MPLDQEELRADNFATVDLERYNVELKEMMKVVAQSIRIKRKKNKKQR